MKRTQKTALVEKMVEEFRNAPHLIVTEFRGLTVNQSSDLRSRIRKAGGSFRVVKNRLAKRAASGTAAERVAAHLVGPRGVACHASDPVGLAKVLSDFAKEHPQLRLVAAVVDAKDLVDAEGVKALAALPGAAELRAQLLALIQTPATQLLRLLNTPSSQLARVIDARRERLGEGGG